MWCPVSFCSYELSFCINDGRVSMQHPQLQGRKSHGLVLAVAPPCLLPVLSRASPSPVPLLPLLFRDLFLDFGFLGPVCNHSALSSQSLGSIILREFSCKYCHFYNDQVL